MKLAALATAILGVATAVAFAPQDPSKERLKASLRDTNLVGPWVYDDMDEGFAQARKSGKPLLVVIRCVP